MKLTFTSSQLHILSSFCVDVAKSLFVGAFLGQIVVSENSGLFRFGITSIVLISSLFMLFFALKLNYDK